MAGSPDSVNEKTSMPDRDRFAASQIFFHRIERGIAFRSVGICWTSESMGMPGFISRIAKLSSAGI